MDTTSSRKTARFRFVLRDVGVSRILPTPAYFGSGLGYIPRVLSSSSLVSLSFCSPTRTMAGSSKLVSIRNFIRHDFAELIMGMRPLQQTIRVLVIDTKSQRPERYWRGNADPQPSHPCYYP